jgi:hypothetical protein
MTYDELVTAVTNYTENNVPNVDMNTFIRQAEQRIYNTVQFPSLRKNVTGLTSINNKYLSCPTDFLAAYSMAVIDATGAYEYLLNKDVNFIRQAYPSPNDTAIPKYYALFGPTTTSGANPQITNELSFILGPTPDSAYSVELHYYYYPVSIIRGQLNGIGTITGGTGYVNGTYYDVPLTGGTGEGAKATIVVAGGSVFSVTISEYGSKYVVGNTMSAAASSIGGTGSGFSAPVLSVLNAEGTSWLGDNFDSVLLYGTLVEAYTYMKGEADMMALYDGKYKEALALAKRLGDGLERSDSYRSGQYRLSPLPQNNGVA